MNDVITYRIVLGKAIRKVRKDKNIHQDELAFNCNSHQNYISEIESGKRNITISNLVAIANNLDVKLGTLFTLADTYMEGSD